MSVFDKLKLVDMKTEFGALSELQEVHFSPGMAGLQPWWNCAETIVPWAGTSLCYGPSFNWSIPGPALCEISTKEFLIYD